MKNKKIVSFFSIFTVVCSSILFVYHFFHLCLCLLGFDSVMMGIFSLIVMALVSLPVIFRDRLRRILGKAFLVFHIFFAVCMCVCIVSVTVLWCHILMGAGQTADSVIERYKASDDFGEGTVVMVFGCRTHGYSPSLTLKLRLDEAYSLLKALPDAVCIVSGGQGSNETVPEADAMEAYLVGLGIEKERIIKESYSHSTSENIRLTKALIESTGMEYKKIIGVSTAFHLQRIKILSKRYSLPMDICSSPSPSPAHFYVSMVREYLSYIKMIFFDKAVLITKIA